MVAHPQSDALSRTVRVRFPSNAERAYFRLLDARLGRLRAAAEAAAGIRADVGESARVLAAGASVGAPPTAELGRIASLVDARVLADLERLLGSDPWWSRGAGRAVAQRWATANVAWIRSIDSRYLDEVAAAVVEYAGDPEKLAAVLEERYGVARSRASLIARDQIGSLHSDLSDSHAAVVGLTEYVWRTQRDGRVRPAHAAHEGKTYRRGELAEEPGQGIACRCVREWVVRMVPVPARRAVPGARIRL